MVNILENFQVADFMSQARTMSSSQVWNLADHNVNLFLAVKLVQKGLNLEGERPSLSKVKGVRWVDLGCGSRYVEYGGKIGSYVPLLSMVLGVLGARSIGVDIEPAYPNDERVYRHIQADIVKVVRERELLSIVGRAQVVTANCSLPEDYNPGMIEAIVESGIPEKEWYGRLEDQISAILIPGGIYMVNSIVKLRK